MTDDSIWFEIGTFSVQINSEGKVVGADVKWGDSIKEQESAIIGLDTVRSLLMSSLWVARFVAMAPKPMVTEETPIVGD
jgi:hypothetical protein